MGRTGVCCSVRLDFFLLGVPRAVSIFFTLRQETQKKKKQLLLLLQTHLGLLSHITFDKSHLTYYPASFSLLMLWKVNRQEDDIHRGGFVPFQLTWAQPGDNTLEAASHNATGPNQRPLRPETRSHHVLQSTLGY